MAPNVMRSAVTDACVQWEADLKGLLLGILKKRDLAEDVFQKTVIRSIEAAQTARLTTLRGWLFQIALNEARQYLRQQKREAKHQERFAKYVSIDQAERQKNSEWILDLGVVNEEMVQAIQRSLVRLPVEQQEVIRRRIHGGETFATIAEQMKLPLGTVLTWMRRGLLRLKEDSQLRKLVDDES
jgi:RNA polymerase sigma-70 factor (ECF subfamily)